MSGLDITHLAHAEIVVPSSTVQFPDGRTLDEVIESVVTKAERPSIEVNQSDNATPGAQIGAMIRHLRLRIEALEERLYD